MGRAIKGALINYFEPLIAIPVAFYKMYIINYLLLRYFLQTGRWRVPTGLPRRRVGTRNYETLKSD